MRFIETFPDVDTFMAKLREEAELLTRFPVRLILVEGLRSWQELLPRLRQEADHRFYLSSFCTGADVYPIATKLLRSIEEWLKEGESGKLLILPWSEWLRLEAGQEDSSGALECLVDLAQREKVGKKRIYVPLFECSEVINLLKERLTRYRVRESGLPPVWKVIGEGLATAEVLPFTPKEAKGCMVEGIKAYLEHWEKGGAEKTVLVTCWAHKLKECHASFTIRVYPNAYRMLSERVNPWPEAVREEWGTEMDWRWLAEASREGESFSELAARLLNMREYDIQQIVSSWRNWRREKRWLAWLWSKVEGKVEGYVARVLAESSSSEQFEEKLMFGVLMQRITPEEVQQRKKLLTDMGFTELPKKFLDQAEEITDLIHRLACLAGFSDKERELVVLTVGELLEKNVPEKEWWGYLEVVYPELTWYLTVPLSEPFLQEYFLNYTRSRLRDKAHEHVLEQARQMANEQPLWRFRSREQALEECRYSSTRVLWADGMGIEWLGALLGALNEYRRVKADFEVVRANLPTVTECNRGWESEEWVERAVDKEGHENPYPRALVKQLEAVRRLARRVVELLEHFEEVVVTADHGLTRFARSSGGFQLPENVKVDKWGRCATLPPGFPIETLPRPDCLVDGNTLVLLTHERIRGCSGASYQVHGGATPEEWLVPVVRVRRALKEVEPEAVRVQVLTPLVRLSARGEGEFRLRMAGYEGELELQLQRHVFKGKSEAESVWVFNLRGLKRGKHQGVLRGGGKNLTTVEFEVQRGLVEEDLGL